MKYQSVSDRQSSQDEVIEATKNSEDIAQVMKIEHYSKLIDSNSSSNSPDGSEKSELREQRQRQTNFKRYPDVSIRSVEKIKRGIKSRKRQLQLQEDAERKLRLQEREHTTESNRNAFLFEAIYIESTYPNKCGAN
jgi:hypothetical protein